MNRTGDSTVSMRHIWLGLASITLLVLGMIIGWFGHSTNEFICPLRENGYEFIRPLLLCNIDGLTQNEDQELSSKIRAYTKKIKGADGDIGVYYLNPTQNTWAGVNENKSFSPASMLKVPIMTAILRHQEQHQNNKHEYILYDGSFDYNQMEMTKPIHPLVAGTTYSTEELLKQMIVESDNNATQLLYSHLSKEDFKHIFIDLGITAPTVNGPVDFMSAKTFTLFLRILYNASYLSREHSEQALALMSQSTFTQGLRAGVPTNIRVAEKFGEREQLGQPGELHNCGIVYYRKDSAYILCVMTQGNDRERLTTHIKEISNLVYTHVTK